ncbi:S9 family peptidase [Sediminibacillus halophilus]|uniref:Dipeptidyl aminopeptidase/acylaminoacyl peptidase n=1 Tax=Sediminibacillus halophilus TaxID=482461 RepID=A0A1G9RXR7_9BACI|nr:S9 family peptidase [Sediminibacillus halophilus]SDM28059.1 Dipeptidyl aminopeptidase/acylaminoacyl peptidase [Sediminibacillus halophilus]
MLKKAITADDLLRFSFLSDPQLSPDGNWVVYAVRTINEKKKYQSNLYVVNLTTNETIPFTHGESMDYQPRWSPDGQTIVFTSNRSGKQQVWKISFRGGEAVQLTNFKHGASQPVFSPDGHKLLLKVPLSNQDSVRDEATDKDDEGNDKEAYATTRIKYKSDNSGLLPDTYQQLVMWDLQDETAVQLTSGEFGHEYGCFSPDGSRIAFSANRTNDPDRSFVSDIFEYDIKNGNLTKLTNGTGMFMQPNYAPDGRRLSLLGHDLTYAGATLTRVWVLDIDSKQLTCLTDDWDVQASDVAINDMGTSTAGNGALWDKQQDRLYFLASQNGNTSVYQVSMEKQVSTVTGGSRQIYAFQLDYKGNAVIAVSDQMTPGDLYYIPKSGGDEKRLTNVNKWLAGQTLSPAEEIHFPASDGQALHGWIMKPAGFTKGGKHPLIVEVHGGPHAMYSNAFMHEFQVLAAAGYGVLFINPRGSHGYGQTFVDAVRGDYGGKDYQDILDAVNYATSHFDWIDENRIGITGGSYGGFMTNWAVGHTNRFKAAVTQRSISNWISFYGVSDIGYFFTDWELKTNLLDDPDRMWKHSPLRYVKEIETPLLILHSEEDYRCPIEQGEQLYVALKHQNKTTKFVRFPGSNHELSRSGDPSLRIRRLNEIKDWFDQYL